MGAGGGRSTLSKWPEADGGFDRSSLGVRLSSVGCVYETDPNQHKMELIPISRVNSLLENIDEEISSP